MQEEEYTRMQVNVSRRNWSKGELWRRQTRWQSAKKQEEDLNVTREAERDVRVLNTSWRT